MMGQSQSTSGGACQSGPGPGDSRARAGCFPVPGLRRGLRHRWRLDGVPNGIYGNSAMSRLMATVSLRVGNARERALLLPGDRAAVAPEVVAVVVPLPAGPAGCRAADVLRAGPRAGPDPGAAVRSGFVGRLACSRVGLGLRGSTGGTPQVLLAR